MRIRDSIAAAAILTAFGAAGALANEPSSAYLGVGGGAVFLPEEKLENGAKIDTDTGWMADGTLGVRWKGGWRLELEGAHRENDANIGPVSGEIKSTSVMVNVLRDLDMGWKIIPYIGGGIGWVQANYRLPVPGSNQKDTGGIWQAIGGASLPINDKLEVFADYRYFDTYSLDDINLGGSFVKDSYHGHAVTAGLRWTFWNEAPPAPVAAPAPAPMAQPKDYVIYFEFDKSNITKAAGAVLDELKATSGGSSVSVAGHTDTMGSAAYNQKLSERRANNTAKALDTRGVKVDSVTGKGFSEPAVNTGPGVKEPLNRRAVIKLNSAGMPSQ